MPYERTPAQQRYLQHLYAKRRDEETDCDCTGCDTCTGNVRNCTCDIKRLDRYIQHEANNPPAEPPPKREGEFPF